MRTNLAWISRLEALNSETLDYKTSALTSLLLCLLKSNCQQKAKCYGNADWRGFFMYLEINFIFIYPILTLIWIFLSSLNTGGFAPYKETRCTTVAFGDLSVTLLELEMFQSSNEMDGKYLPFLNFRKT